MNLKPNLQAILEDKALPLVGESLGVLTVEGKFKGNTNSGYFFESLAPF